MGMEIQTFETIIIFDGNLTEEEYSNKVKDMRGWLAGLPAVKIKTKLVGKKELAYAVRNCGHGWYVDFIYQSTKDLINTKFDLILRKDDDVMKFLTLDYQGDYTPDDNDGLVNRKKPVDVFNLIFGIED